MTNISYKICLLFFILFTNIQLFASNPDSSYQITVKIKDYKNSEIYLGHHFGIKKIVDDTSKTDENGVVVFKGKLLEGGIYLIAFPTKEFFEIIVDKDQIFTIETDTINYVNSMKISGSKDNEIFNQYQRKMQKFQIQTYEIDKRIRKNETNADSVKILTQKIEIVQKEIRDTWAKEAKENTGTLFGKLIKAMIEPEFPKDSSIATQYYKEHYWENIDLTDDRLLRTPILQAKLNRFMNNAVEQHPDSVVKWMGKLIFATKTNEKMYRFFVMQILNNYEASNAYAMDQVFIYLAEKHIVNNAQFWNNQHFIDITNYKIKIKKGITNGQVAPNLQIIDRNEKLSALHDVVGTLTVLYFWEPDCGHCQKTTPILHNLYQKFKNVGLQIFAVNCGTNKDEWTNYLDSNNFNDFINVYDPNRTSNFMETFDVVGTPVIYLLDENKRIIAKKINVETLEKLLVYFVNRKQK